MKAVSNSTGIFNPLDPGPRGAPRARQVTAAEVHPALRVLMGDPSEADLVDFLRMCLARQINLTDMRIVVDASGRIHWTILPVTHPGRTSLLFTPPAPVESMRLSAAREGLEQMSSWLAGRGSALVQSLLDPEEEGTRELFESARFTTISELMYLQGRPGPRSAMPDLPDGFSWITYNSQTHALFAHAIAGSYEGSLDCPALNGRRSTDDIIAGHKATGQFDPERWMVLCRAAADRSPKPLGVLLLNRAAETETMELVYLGLIPQARGLGLGDVLIRQAMAAARLAGCADVALAVDAENDPALRLYHRHGFEYVGRRWVVVRDLESGAAPLRGLKRPGQTSTPFPQAR